ncbi:orphan sodium- and chloride-dependent neurotransmitter transporter NTT5 isoform X1 [Dama dama]|uniref:orphan sodium- and chloride-dependent neurotransmitter transporter NTT5 isoform X1 n=1 Tax=Dama dama TaxID=30532 RepID=UPI002A35F746|nr:orphan sodium- and chloride-dependent neurotransmitter transporter NTT5 isoform X1 [Dama dama]
MRSTHKIKSSLVKVGAAPESLPEMVTEAQASGVSLGKVSSVESSPEDHALENKGTGTWSLTAWVSEVQAFEARAVRAQAWETQAFEAQSRASHPKVTPVTGAAAAPVLRQRFLPEKVQVPEEEKSELLITRPFWSNKAEYLLAQVGYTMRPASLWSFCYLWLHSGGGIFLIIYIFLLFLIGIPLLFLEMTAGQRMRQGNIGVWKAINPWTGGVGYTSLLPAPPWPLGVLHQRLVLECDHCLDPLLLESVLPVSRSVGEMSLTGECQWLWHLQSQVPADPECARTTPSLYFWYRMTLKASDSIENNGPPVLSLTLPLFVSLCLLGAFMLKGLKWTGKVMCVLVSTSCLIMLYLVVRSIMLEGAVFGLHYMTVVKISTIADASIWHGAGNQVLCSLGLGFGAIVSIASHMESSNSCLSDAVIVALANLVSMMLVTPFIFSVLGFWATQLTHHCNAKNIETILKLVNMGILPPEAQPPQNLIGNPTSIFTSWFNSLSHPIKKEVLSHVSECNLEEQFLKIKESTNFAFLAFIEAMSFIPGSISWSILFFLMLLNLELSTMIGITHSIITSLQDIFISVQKYTKLFTVVVLMLMFLCGLFFTRPSGSYYIRLLTDYWTIIPIIIIIIFENLAVNWARKAGSFFPDTANPWGRPMYTIMHWLWFCLIPFVLLALFMTSVFQLSQKNITYLAWNSSISKEVVRQYPSWGPFTLFALSLTVILPIPIYFVYCFTHGIPSNSTSRDKPMISSKSLPVSLQLTPIEEVENEEILQGDTQIADQPVV